MLKVLYNKLRATLRREGKPHEWFTGNYASWEEAQNICTGYDAPNILEKVKTAVLKVKNGEAAFERDSVVFDEIQYSMPLLVSLLYTAGALGNRLSILDFGGALGSSFYQNRNFLDKLDYLCWSIVEQEHFVDCGVKNFQSEQLKFFTSIESCEAEENPDVVLLSSVLPYIENPYGLLKTIFEKDFKYIIIDRTPFFLEDLPDRITIQHVPESIYKAEYPAWFFNEAKFIGEVEKYCRVIEVFPGNDQLALQGSEIQYRCLLLEKLNQPSL